MPKQVEGYKLTPEAKQFGKQVRRKDQIKKALLTKLVATRAELSRLQESFQQFSKMEKELMASSPSRLIDELDSQSENADERL